MPPEGQCLDETKVTTESLVRGSMLACLPRSACFEHTYKFEYIHKSDDRN